MADKANLSDVISTVVDPLLERPIGELNMVGSVDRRRLGADRVTLLLPVPNYPVTAELERRLTRALEAAGLSAEVEFEVMDDAQRAEMMGGLRSQSSAGLGETGSRTRTVAISSGKGGVGKSSVTSNLAIALRSLGHTVGVIDADIWGFSLPRMLGADRPPVVIDESIIPPVAHGVKVMSMDFFVGEDKAVVWRGPMLHKAIEQFLKDVFWDDPDFILVDMPPGTGDVSISLSQFLPRAQVVVVTTPQPTAQRVARRAALMAREVDQEVIGVVENMSWFSGDDGTRYEIFGSGGGEALAGELGVDLLAQVPLLPAMRQGADVGEPVNVAAAGSEAERAFLQLAEAVVARKPRIRTHPDLVIR
ncbi:MAG: Mrp/NBP35 family ATP-binding protein [Acidimicrobiia bacterium]|nr:Mrp/NBP35 family ATP-binding protein [Acidimicrobiia bacterium]